MMNRISNANNNNEVEFVEAIIPMFYEMDDGRFVSTTIKTEDGAAVINPVLAEIGISLEDLSNNRPSGGFYIID